MKSAKQPNQDKGLSVLFADDEESLQDLMAMELPRMGHTVTVCPDGASAINQASQQSYDCLIVDLDMPGIGGVEVIRQVKQRSPQTEAVVLTGKKSLETAVAAMRFGACDYLTKPCSWNDLRQLLQGVQDRRELVHRSHPGRDWLWQRAGGSWSSRP
jgi:two-component system NtrC family response regulator